MANKKLEEKIQQNLTPTIVLAIVAVSSFLIGSHLQPKQQIQEGVTTVSGDTSGTTTSVVQDIKTAAEQPPANTTAPVVQATSSMVNINTASAAELDTLPGVGPATAQKIIDYRTAHGPFKSVDDLINVNGIGPSKLGEIKPKAAI